MHTHTHRDSLIKSLGMDLAFIMDKSVQRKIEQQRRREEEGFGVCHGTSLMLESNIMSKHCEHTRTKTYRKSNVQIFTHTFVESKAFASAPLRPGVKMCLNWLQVVRGVYSLLSMTHMAFIVVFMFAIILNCGEMNHKMLYSRTRRDDTMDFFFCSNIHNNINVSVKKPFI